MCTKDYPEEYGKGFRINGLEKLDKFIDDIQVFYAGAEKVNNEYLTTGGRVLNVTAKAETLKEAQDKVYKACQQVHWEGCFYRNDIGYRAL
jgi:phosphoribosylamine--glycine ligase